VQQQVRTVKAGGVSSTGRHSGAKTSHLHKAILGLRCLLLLPHHGCPLLNFLD
jgi:hypothetical protein